MASCFYLTGMKCMFVVTSANIIVHVSAAAMLNSKVWGFCFTTFKLQSVVNAWDHADFPPKSNEPAGAFCADWTHIITTQGISRAWRKGTECCKPSQVLKIHILTFIASFTVRPRLCKSQFLLFYCTGHRPCGWSKSNQFLSRLPVWGNGCRPEMENFKLGIVLMKMCTGFPNPR